MVRNATLVSNAFDLFWKEMFLVSVQLICYKSWHFTICCNIYFFYTLIYLFWFINLKHSFWAVAKYFVGSNQSLTCYLLPAEEREEPAEGLLYRQQESHLCQQMKLATVSQQGQESAAGWFQEETATCSTTQPCPGHYLRIKVSYKNMRRLNSTDNAHNSTVSDCARLLFFFFHALSLRPAAVCQQWPVEASRPQPNPLQSPAQHAKAFHPFHRYQVPARNHSNASDPHASLPQRQHLRGNQTET